ncbi:lariat debranching enzyme [Tilletia horrida]|nr:lariat debranching enzyme [Tilletia horrida]
MRVAVEGCSHGELDLIYERVLAREREDGAFFDVLLLCGDFQAIRNHADLHSLAVPDKYRQLGQFWKYYAGVKQAPLLTIVIGGNHEASNYMYELYYGGWLAPNIYFLGEAGCVEVGDLVIAGASGIFKKFDYYRGRYERQPYDKSGLRSIYHTRVYDIARLKLLPQVDIVMSHDWPNTIELHGNTNALLKRKPFFAEEINTSTLGSPPLLELLKILKPAFWCAAHLHVRFDAKYRHDGSAPKAALASLASGSAQPQVATADPNQIDIDDFDDDDDAGMSAAPAATKPASDPNQIDIDDDDDDEDVDGEPIAVPSSATPVVKDFGDKEEPLVPAPESGSSAADVPDASQDASPAKAEPSDVSTQSGATTFLALGKCIKSQTYLEFFNVERGPSGRIVLRPSNRNALRQRLKPSNRPQTPLYFHRPWLAIVRALHPWLSLEMHQPPLPSASDLAPKIREASAWIGANVVPAFSKGEGGEKEGKAESVLLPVTRVQRFALTAPPPPPESLRIVKLDLRRIPPSPPYLNPQTAAFCNMLGLDLRINSGPLKCPAQLLSTSFLPQFVETPTPPPAPVPTQAPGPNPNTDQGAQSSTSGPVPSA